MNILIFGPQGSGKGTQAQLLAEKFGFIHIEAGNLLREVAKTDPRINEIINVKGELVPAEETLALIEKKIENSGGLTKGVIFDGIPRAHDQYAPLKKWLEEREQKVDLALLITLPEEETIRRLSGRRVCGKCGEVFNVNTNPSKVEGICDNCGGTLIHRVDDQPETIKKRLKLYHERTEPLLQEFRNDGIVREFDGGRSIEEIQKDLVRAIKEKMEEVN
jgi:adenylate kinase